MSANVNSMMYVGQTPWHGFGKKLDKAATSAEAISAAGLDWKVNKEAVFLSNGVQVPSSFATVRQDTGKVLGVVGKVYEPLQNRDAFRFFDSVVGIKEAMYQTAGSLGKGECVWILAKLPGIVRVVGDDVTEKYLLLTNRHDGLGAVQVFFTPIRVVCQNTLNIALKGEGTKASLRHTTTIGMKVEEVRKQLGIIHASFGIFEEAARRMATVQLTTEAFNNYIKKSGVIPDDEEKLGTRAANVRDELTRLFEYGKGADLPGSKGTVWGAFNAVAEYVDYFKPARGQGKSDREDSRAKSILFGSGLSLKQTAWDAALEIAR